jgi:hypothetical protein
VVFRYVFPLGGFFSSRNKSAVSAANSARATVLFGCKTMSHPAGISSRWQRTISRRRRRIRLRTTAPPSAFLMLKPKRLCGSSLARKKTVKWELERRFPARYTVSNSAFRTSRASRGNSCPSPLALAEGNGLPGLFGGKPMTSLLAARRQHLAPALRLHAYAEAVRLGAPAFARLKCALWQNNPPLLYLICNTRSPGGPYHPRRRNSTLPSSPAAFESNSVFDPRTHGQENRVAGIGSI